jgi:hypothetical protein
MLLGGVIIASLPGPVTEQSVADLAAHLRSAEFEFAPSPASSTAATTEEHGSDLSGTSVHAFSKEKIQSRFLQRFALSPSKWSFSLSLRGRYSVDNPQCHGLEATQFLFRIERVFPKLFELRFSSEDIGEKKVFAPARAPLR